jgi:hypothetical protein
LLASVTPAQAKDLRKLMVVLDPKVDTTMQVSFVKPGTPPLAAAALRPLEQWADHGVLKTPA